MGQLDNIPGIEELRAKARAAHEALLKPPTPESIPKPAVASDLEDVLVFSEGTNIFVIDNDFSIHQVASRDKWITALCSYGGQLYDGGAYKKVVETLTGREVASRDDGVLSLCSHGGQLYDGGHYNKVFETLTSREVASRSCSVYALCSHPRKYFVEAGILD